LCVGVLGPLLVTRDGAAVGLLRGRPGVLLAVLAMSAGRPVGADRLAGLLWDDDRPEHLRASLNTVVARLRRMVSGAVVTVGDGYLLDISPDHVDVLRFRRLAREAGEADGRASALGLFDQALDLWRGEPLADLGSAALARDVVPGLTDEYLSAVQRRADLRLEAGQGDLVIAELRELTARHPLREPLWGQLIRALAADGSARTWLRAERANLGACLGYAIDAGLAERVVALSAGLANLLRTEGPWSTGIDVQAAAANAAARLGDQSGRARALTELGNLQGLTDDYPGAEASLRAALELLRETGDRVGEAHALIRLGAVQNVSGDPPGAEANLQAALKLHRETGDKTGEAHALIQLIQVQRLTGEYEDAVRNGESALVIVQGLGDRLYLATALNKLGVAHCLVGDYASAARNQQAAHEVYRELGNRLGQANALTGLAEARRLTGDQAGAARDLEEAIGIFQDLGIRGSEAWALNYYAAVIADAGDPGRAIAVYSDALRLAREVRQPDDEAIALQGLGEAHARMGKSEDGAAYLREALGIFRRLGMPAAEQVTKRLAEIGALTAAPLRE
jgi:DNA-binding SARP family transcriptional activator